MRHIRDAYYKDTQEVNGICLMSHIFLAILKSNKYIDNINNIINFI